MIDTHIHIDGEEFAEDLADVVARAKDAGCEMMFVPGVNLSSLETVPTVCQKFPGYLFPMIGLHPEDVRADWQEVVAKMKESVAAMLNSPDSKLLAPIAIGEVGLDFYWSREFEKEQLLAFEEIVKWSIDIQLPLMLHCRKAQNEMVAILKKYKNDLIGGVVHCFSGNALEAKQLLEFDNFVLGIGGILTFKKSNLPETLKEAVPLSRIVIETDAPYLAPVPVRGQRNESSFLTHVVAKLAEVYGVSPEEIDRQTTETAKRILLNSRR